MRTERLAGADALRALCALLRRCRLADPTWGAWEAADMQWWWRFDQRADDRDCTVWFDAESQPTMAVTAANFKDGMLADVIRMPFGAIPEAAIAVAADVVARHADRDIWWSCPTDDAALAAAYRSIGAEPIDERMIETWMAAGDVPPLPPCPDGYTLRTRAEAPDGEHHMVRRSGPEVESRLNETDLYRPDLDLSITAPDGGVAGYALFWADPTTRVGLVEPMRVEDAHQSRGLARHLLIAGAQRLVAAGCERIKVSYLDDNPIAGRTYVGAGFRPVTTVQTYANQSPATG